VMNHLRFIIAFNKSLNPLGCSVFSDISFTLFYSMIHCPR
jgi:hypothetical protein